VLSRKMDPSNQDLIPARNMAVRMGLVERLWHFFLKLDKKLDRHLLGGDNRERAGRVHPGF
jgi:hypothetical protein